MEVHLSHELQAKLEEAARNAGCQPDELDENVMAAYLEEVVQVRDMLDRRYDDIKSGRVKPIDGERFLEELEAREHEAHLLL